MVGGLFFIFQYTGNNHPNWLIFFRGVGQPPTRFGSFGFVWNYGTPRTDDLSSFVPTIPCDTHVTFPCDVLAQRGTAWRWMTSWLQMPVQLFMPSLGMLLTLLVPQLTMNFRGSEPRLNDGFFYGESLLWKLSGEWLWIIQKDVQIEKVMKHLQVNMDFRNAQWKPWLLSPNIESLQSNFHASNFGTMVWEDINTEKKLCVRPFTWIEAWCFPSLNGCGVYHGKPDEPDTLPSTFYMTGIVPLRPMKRQWLLFTSNDWGWFLAVNQKH